MSTTQLVIIIVLGIAILAVIVAAVMKNMPKQNDQKPPASGGGTQTQTGATQGGCIRTDNYGAINSATLDNNKTLSRGVIGAEVAQLQRILNQKGACLVVDGNFGPATEAALKSANNGNGSTTLAAFSGNTNPVTVGSSSGTSIFDNVLAQHNAEQSLYKVCGGGAFWGTDRQCFKTYQECRNVFDPEWLGFTCVTLAN